MTLQDDYYTDEEVAGFMGISKTSLNQRRCAGRNHPPYIKIGRKILYPKKEFANWLKSHPLKKAIA